MLLNCPDCGKSISGNTEICRYCGAIVQRTPQPDKKTVSSPKMALKQDDEGLTMAVPDSSDITEEASSPPSPSTNEIVGDLAESDGATTAMFDLEETYPAVGSTQVMPLHPTLMDEDGATRAVLSDDKDEDTRPILVEDDDGGTRAVAEAEGGTEDDGATAAIIALPAEEEGGTKPVADPTAPPPTPTPKTIISHIRVGHILQKRYRVDKILGRGGFGAAYLAEDIRLKRVCVVKQMLMPKKKSVEALRRQQNNFEREAGLLAQLNTPGHPNIPEIYDFFTEESGNYLVMKYIEGRDLKEVIDESDGKMPWREAVSYVANIANALSYMHASHNEPIMHRDIKAANILLGDDGRVWLIDFGLAKADPVEAGREDFEATQALGSFGYTPLEQWFGEAAPASDIYALGATLHYLITGLNPLKAYEGEYHIQKIQEQHGQFSSIRTLDRKLPKELDSIIQQAVAPDPARRPTALQLQQQLKALISNSQGTALFTFKNGESAKTTGQLVDLCEKYRREAEGYLYKGDFERWFVIVNRNDLAEAAIQAIARGKNQGEGLEKFLKLIVPNLVLRRLGKAGRRAILIGLETVLVTAIVLFIVAFSGSMITRWFIQRSIGGYDWNYTALNLERPNRFSEAYLTQQFRRVGEVYIDELRVFVHEPDQLEVRGKIWGYEFRLPATLQVQQKKPHFFLSQINDNPLYFIGNNITEGINRGVDDAFEDSPVDVSELAVQEGGIIFSVEPSGRAPFPTLTPPSPTLPTPTPTPNLTLLAIFNELDQGIILELDGQSWEIPAHDTKVIEKAPGIYEYTARYKATGQMAATGTKTWEVNVYRWRIGLDD